MGKFSCMNESKKIEMKKKVFFYMKSGDTYFLTSTYLPDNNTFNFTFTYVTDGKPMTFPTL